MPLYLILLVIGLGAGVCAGMFGIGGGIVIVPALMFIAKMKQVDAVGTSLAALIPPVGILGALEYYRNGHINVKYAALLAVGLAAGAYFGAKIMIGLPAGMARKLYAVFMIVIGLQMLFEKRG
ncbi:MAG: sulfite exporter TauE/SafE family protein [Bryobacterales bacterium]|nr:sulfite exporter TauE/SafE family protein [Bryobacterales bacterium]